MTDFNSGCVCEGYYGEMETEGNRTTMGYNVQCPNGNFTVEGEKGSATSQLKRMLSAKGCDANITDETRGTSNDEEVDDNSGDKS